MKIQLVQSEIELAISNYIRETITVNEGMSITMELRATRGAEGFQADIDISRTADVTAAVAVAKAATAQASQTPRAVTKAAPVGQPTSTPDIKPAAAIKPALQPAVEPDEPEHLPTSGGEDTGSVDQSQEQVAQPEEASSSPAADPNPPAESTAEAAPVKRSLFAGLKKPVNPA